MNQTFKIISMINLINYEPVWTLYTKIISSVDICPFQRWTFSPRHTEVYLSVFDKKPFYLYRLDLANATNDLAGGVQTQLNKIDKQIRSLSKTVQDNTVSFYQTVQFYFTKISPIIDESCYSRLSKLFPNSHKKCCKSFYSSVFYTKSISYIYC